MPSELAATHSARIERVDDRLYGIGTEPEFAIGQRALLVRSGGLNLLWDCTSLMDEATVAGVNALGGVDAIAISHPHFYTAMVDWAQAFDAPVLLHAQDRDWVMRDDARIRFWEGDRHVLNDDLTLVRLGGHFPGGTVLHWQGQSRPEGALLSGDIVQVVADRDWVSFMYSYPNTIPLPAFEVERIATTVAAYRFDTLYGGWWQTIVHERADTKVQRSAERYLAALAGRYHRPPG
ncbi:Lactoylglutathione lyase [Salinisphaera sp. T31B1]